MTIPGARSLFLLAVLTTGCDRIPFLHPTAESAVEAPLQGYVEGRYLYVASPLGGTLERLDVARGSNVLGGAPLFGLEAAAEQAAIDAAQRRLDEARAKLADLEKGARDSEIAAHEAALAEAQASLVFSTAELKRQEELQVTADATPRDVEQARARRDADQERVKFAAAELATARLPARSDTIAAARENVAARVAELEQARWSVTQKSLAAAREARVFDTFYRVGEYVPAGRPVVALLAPEDIEVRAFIPEKRLAGLALQQEVEVSADGIAPIHGRVTFISPNAEFTPPVVYSTSARAKFVIPIVITFEPEIAKTLHPGQPVDVRIGGGK